ncbi:MAG: hypothetical protein IJW45_06165 [Oscillospiraceae bacterium]|nr:hypothetical protein [Oscillospiraceae bacterium]
MILQVDDWRFDIDLKATMAYSAEEVSDHCTCDYCLNFYATIDRAYPDIRPFLARFAVDIEGPDELMTFDHTRYLGAYAVSGHILQFGSAPIRVNGISILPENAEDAMVNTGCLSPFFILTVGMLTLPWVLEVAPEDVVSPANTPSFLRKMWDKIMKYRPMDDLLS